MGKLISTKTAAAIWALNLRTAQRYVERYQTELGAQLVAGVYMLDEDKVRQFTPPQPKRGRKPSRKEGD